MCWSKGNSRWEDLCSFCNQWSGRIWHTSNRLPNFAQWNSQSQAACALHCPGAMLKKKSGRWKLQFRTLQKSSIEISRKQILHTWVDSFRRKTVEQLPGHPSRSHSPATSNKVLVAARPVPVGNSHLFRFVSMLPGASSLAVRQNPSIHVLLGFLKILWRCISFWLLRRELHLEWGILSISPANTWQVSECHHRSKWLEVYSLSRPPKKTHRQTWTKRLNMIITATSRFYNRNSSDIRGSSFQTPETAGCQDAKLRQRPKRDCNCRNSR